MSITLSCSPENLFSDFAESEPESKAVKITLPEWPADFPQLSHWKIEINYCDYSQTRPQPPDQKSFIVEVPQKFPVSVMAFPVIAPAEIAAMPDKEGIPDKEGMPDNENLPLSENQTVSDKSAAALAGNLSGFFKPCGTVFPDCCGGTDAKSADLSWSGGFAATVLSMMYKANPGSKNYDMLMFFNWARFIKELQEKEAKSVPGFGAGKMYFNPWYCQIEKIASNIQNGSFKSNSIFLNEGKTVTLSELELDVSQYENLISPYVPEAEAIKLNKRITVLKSDAGINNFMLCKKSCTNEGALDFHSSIVVPKALLNLTYNSSKKISLVLNAFTQ